jgi:hypothetical protein
VVAAVAGQQAQAQPIDLNDTVKRAAPPAVDIKGSALGAFLNAYVPVRNEDVKAAAFSSASATAVFSDQERGITLMYAACPWQTASLGMITGPPHMLVFVVDHGFVICQLRDLCRQPPPGFTPTR